MICMAKRRIPTQPRKKEGAPPAPSDAYQYLFKEVLVAPHDLGRGVADPLWEQDTEDQRARQELRRKMYERLKLLAQAQLTDRQLQIFELYFEQGLSQMDIAKKLNLAQPSVYKCIYGNQITFGNGRENNKFYGGFIKKLAKIVAKDEQLSKWAEELGV